MLKDVWKPTLVKKNICKSIMLGPSLFSLKSYLHRLDNSQGENIYKNVSILLGQNFEFKMFMF
jgi:hypothetical protein